MCSYELVYGKNRRHWRITALELYLHTASDIWRDPYAHQNSAQVDSGTWYVHDDGRRAPIYSGIDITCGSNDTYASLLIRELDNEHRWVFQKILRGEHVIYERKGNTWNEEEKVLIQKSIHRQPINSGLLKLVPAAKRELPLYIGPRIGLKKKTNDPCNPEGIKFKDANLRIATSQTEVLKTSMNLYDHDKIIR